MIGFNYKSKDCILRENVSSLFPHYKEEIQKKLRTPRHTFFSRYPLSSLSIHPFQIPSPFLAFLAAVPLRPFLWVS